MKKQIKNIYGYSNIDNLIPDVRGQRAFPTMEFKDSDPFLMLDHIGPQAVGEDYRLNGEGHDHPHRGFETITFMFEGRMDHRDSLGNKATLISGSVQRMNAGKGIIHGGDMAADQDTGRFHEMQLWVNNPLSEKMSEPGIHNVSTKEIPTIEKDGYILRVISGKLNGVEGPIKTKASTQIGHFISNANSELTIDTFDEETRLMVYVLEGSIKIGEQTLNEFQLATFGDPGDSITVQGLGEAQALILAGKPLNEPVAFGGPFVMNTQDEIEEAHADFQRGEFGAIAV